MPRVVYEDDHIVAVSKPAGMPSVSIKKGEMGTLASWLLDKNPELANLPDGELEAGLLHRLDNDTSGILLAAKTRISYEKLKPDISSLAEKRYLALVVGYAPNEGKIDAPIAHHPRKKKKMLVCAGGADAEQEKAREALTKFRSIARFNLDGVKYTLLIVSIKKGVRHQIRAHLASSGIPISGDELYLNAQKKADDRLAPKRHLLHSHSIEFVHPEQGRKMRLFAPPPCDVKAALIGLYRAQKNLRDKVKARIPRPCKKHRRRRS